MPDTAAPWRALEESPKPVGNVGGGAGDVASAPAPRLPASWIVGIVALAAVLAGAALWLVLTSGHGSIVVEGDGPGLLRSGRPVVVGGASDGADSLAVELVVDVQ